MKDFLATPYVIAVAIPVVLIACGATTKKLVRGSSWERRDFFLGVELALAAMGAALVYFFDLAKQPTPQMRSDMVANALFLVFCFFMLLILMALHQDWETRDDDPAAQITRLGVLANLLGAALLTIFALLVKGA